MSVSGLNLLNSLPLFGGLSDIIMSRHWCRWALRTLPKFPQHIQNISQCGCIRVGWGLWSVTPRTTQSRNFTSKHQPPLGTVVQQYCAPSVNPTKEDSYGRLTDGVQDNVGISSATNLERVNHVTVGEPISDSPSDSNLNSSNAIGSCDDSEIPTCTVQLSPTREKSQTLHRQNILIDVEDSDSADMIEISDEETAITDVPMKSVIKPVHNFAALVNQSETLSKLVLLGVDLSVVEKNRDAADLIVRLDFENDVKPFLFFLHDIGVANENLGSVLTRNPIILQETLEDLRLRVDYLRSKNFTQDAISRIVTKAPNILSFSTVDIDKRLGVYQQEFKLTGAEVREVITRLPKLLTWNIPKVKEVKSYMKDFLGFSKSEIKEILLKQPKIFLSDKHQLGKKFDYLYNVMKISHASLMLWPDVFRTRLHRIRDRHQFLKHLGRDQFDPTKENYISLHALVNGKDRDFCFHGAKSSVTQFNDFLKTS